VATIRNTSPSPATSYASLVPQSGQSLQPFADLQLTEQQRTRIRSIFQRSDRNTESSKQLQKQISSVLTTEQKQTLTARGSDRSQQLSKLLGLPTD
jgi:Spy/CpxP family protein refolding chaperone